MSSIKPVRIIDIARKLKLSTSTIIDFLESNCYPVERSHHTPLLFEILDEIASEFGSGPSIVLLTQLAEESKRWEVDYKETAEKIRNTWRVKTERLTLKRERARKVMEGRERSRALREKYEEKKYQFASAMQTVIKPSTNGSGIVKVDYLHLEIIERALALNQNDKQRLYKYLLRIMELELCEP